MSLDLVAYAPDSSGCVFWLCPCLSPGVVVLLCLPWLRLVHTSIKLLSCFIVFALVAACTYQYQASQLFYCVCLGCGLYIPVSSFSVLFSVFSSIRIWPVSGYSGILCDYLLYALCTAQYTILCIVCLWNGYWAACTALFSIPFG